MYDYRLLKQLTPNDEHEIAAFLQEINGFRFFQSPAFYTICQATPAFRPFYVIARCRGRMVGVLLAYRQTQINLPLLRFLTSRNLIIGGPVVQDGSEAVGRGLLETFRTSEGRSLYTQVRNMHDTAPLRTAFERNGFQYDDHLDIIIDLTRTEEELWKDIHTKRRNEIRRAEKEGCSVVLNNTPEALAACYAILTEVYRRARLPLPDYSYFEVMLRLSTAQTGLQLFTALWEGQIIGCMLCLAYGNTLYDYYAGAHSHFYSKYPNDLLPWAVFKWAKQNGFTCFDFGGAGKPNVPYGVREYKKKFGGTLVNYGRYEAVHHPALFALATRLFALWKFVKR